LILSVAQNSQSRLFDRRNVITTAVPFLTINTNAQSRGFGEIGVVASDLYTQNGLQQNPALLARDNRVIGVQALDYIPWLPQLVSDMYLFSAGFHASLNEKSSIGIFTKHFDLGEVQFADDKGNVIGTANPYEFTIEAKFAQLLAKDLSIGVGIKYIESDLGSRSTIPNGIGIHPAQGLAADLGLDYRKTLIERNANTVKWNFGISILNVGNKLSYTASSKRDFMPQSLKIGNLLTLKRKLSKGDYVAFDFVYQIDKLLVPTPPILAVDEFGNFRTDPNGDEIIEHGKNPNISPIRALYQSFYDAPGGIREETNELIHQFGAEIRLNTLNNHLVVASRAGCFLEHENKGGRKYVTAGVG